MVTQAQRDSLPDVEQQTEFNTPVKVEWWHKYESRRKFKDRSVRSRLADRDPDNPEYRMQGVCIRCFERQKSNIVVKTEEELAELVELLRGGYVQSTYTWCNSSTERVFRRVLGELKKEAGYRNLDVDEKYKSMD